MLELFQYDFMIRAFAAGLMVAVTAPLIGTFLVVRRLSLMAETLAHVALLGVAIGLLVNVSPIVAAVAVAVLVSLGIEKLRGDKRIFGESVLALFLSGSLAIASVLISMANGFNQNLFSYLFGSITTVSQSDVTVTAVLTLATVVTIVALYKELFLTSFDEELAKVSGVRSRAVSAILMILAAITVAVAMRVVGILLIGALMVIPVITAMRIAKSFRQTLIIAVILSLIAVIIGLFLSYYFDLATGGTIVLVSLVLFIASLLYRR